MIWCVVCELATAEGKEKVGAEHEVAKLIVAKMKMECSSPNPKSSETPSPSEGETTPNKSHEIDFSLTTPTIVQVGENALEKEVLKNIHYFGFLTGKAVILRRCFPR